MKKRLVFTRVIKLTQQQWESLSEDERGAYNLNLWLKQGKWVYTFHRTIRIKP